jgi:drug/metabolite transporter (DMT)-like permease
MDGLGALLVTGIFASALAFLVQNGPSAHDRDPDRAVFTLEPVFAALFGYWLAGDRLGAAAWAGSLAIMAGIVLAGRDEAQVAAVVETT